MDYIYGKNDLYKEYNSNTITIGDGKKCMDSSWDNGLEKGSRIFFLDKDGKVDLTQGYWELYHESSWFNNKYTWVYHNHAYGAGHTNNCNHHNSVNTVYTDPNRGDSVYWKSDEQ